MVRTLNIKSYFCILRAVGKLVRTGYSAKRSTNHRNISISNRFSDLTQAEKLYAERFIEGSEEEQRNVCNWIKTFVNSLELLKCSDVVCCL